MSLFSCPSYFVNCTLLSGRLLLWFESDKSDITSFCACISSLRWGILHAFLDSPCTLVTMRLQMVAKGQNQWLISYRVHMVRSLFFLRTAFPLKFRSQSHQTRTLVAYAVTVLADGLVVGVKANFSGPFYETILVRSCCSTLTPG